MALAHDVYRLLLKLYPARFREEYAAPLEQQFRDDYAEARSAGERLSFWGRAVRDLAMSLPREFGREVAHDLRFALRVYRQRSLVTFLALAALALGIGATTGVFSVLDAVLLRSLPFAEPDRLVVVEDAPVNAFDGRSAFHEWWSGHAYLDGVTAYSPHEMNVEANGAAVRGTVAETTAAFFDLLGRRPVLGRAFAPEEETPGRDGVAVIGHGFWQQRFGGDPRALGKTVRVNGTPLVIVGVAPPAFDFPQRTVVWTPTIFDTHMISKSGLPFRRTLGRMNRGLSLAAARSRFRADVARRNPDFLKRKVGMTPDGTILTTHPELLPLREELAGPLSQASFVLLGMVAFVLLVACANVGHLLLSRLSERRDELAIRAALGASRARLVQQLITESVVLTSAAAAGGLVIAYWVSRLAASVLPAQLAAQNYTVLNWRVLAFAVALAALTGIAFGVLPASLIGRAQPSADAWRSRSRGRPGASRLRTALIVLQAALTLALVAGSALMGRTFVRLMGTDLGFRTDHVVTLNVSLAGSRYETGRTERDYYRQAVDRLRALPGVESAAAIQYLPLMPVEGFRGTGFMASPQEKGMGTFAILNYATPGYFRTVGTAVLDGRDFDNADRAGSERVMVVNEAFARELGPGRAVGRRLWDYQGREVTIVGVVRTERLSGPASREMAQVYLAVDQSRPGFATLVARVRGNPASLLSMCRDAIGSVDHQVPVYDIATLDERLAKNTALPRFYTTAILFLSGFALLLALSGVYGVTNYSIGQRTHEIGLRLAVGAGHANLRLLLLRQTLLPALAGTVIGIAGAFGLGRSLQHLVSGVEPLDRWSCVLASAVLLATAAVAAWAATRRILRVDPATALRAE